MSAPILEIICPVCAEVLELSPEDRAELHVGDAIVCESCNAEMEVTANAGEDFELELLGILTVCPNCQQEFDLTEDLLDHAPIVQTAAGEEASQVPCPHCGASVEVVFEELTSGN
jgi:uncharacterized protein YbaR (Trm112 family)